MKKNQSIDDYEFVKIFPNKYIFFCFLGIIATYLFNVFYFMPIGIKLLSLLSLRDYIEGSSYFLLFLLATIYYANTFPWNKFIVEHSLIKVWKDISIFYLVIILVPFLFYNCDIKFLLILSIPLATVGCFALIIRHYSWQNDNFVKKTFFVLALISFYGCLMGFHAVATPSKIFVKYDNKNFPIIRIISSGVIYKNDKTINYVKNSDISLIYEEYNYTFDEKSSIWNNFLSQITTKTSNNVFNGNLKKQRNYPEVPISINTR